ncbi:hypothetical protein GF385_01030 [Candidatus Dependentiae bacterium]|nr:hypothetical protein [Candidatus Dependentiae bacterium]
MKKLLLLILLSTNLIKANNVEPTNQNLSKKEQIITFAKKIKTKGSNLAKKGANVFSFTVDKADKIISKKFLIATAIMVAPGIFVYSKFINPEQAKTIVEKTSKTISKTSTDLVAAGAKGTMQGVAESVVENKKTIGLYYVAANAIPFLVWTMSKIIGPFLDQAGQNLGKLIEAGAKQTPIILKNIQTQT